ncbi:response regulator [Pedosphaera parvula]|uniref:Response regulator receiver protein n=1 Tax=Pedosphaera parvula (strain Ellin514) TaxID=320771 RepID=B9XP06_PEDPL|nr:response regulator [Pedosphaera parvula]EEF58472.1 response regulator receiver protein [Pedosphaera parvula Ellin514]
MLVIYERVLPVILLAEDNEDDVFFFNRSLNRIGVTNPVQVVYNGEDALAYLKGTGIYADRTKYPLPSLCVFDIKMPRLTGLEVLQRLREDPAFNDLAVIVWSTSTYSKEQELANQLGAKAYLVKPTVPGELDATFQSIIQQWLPE